MFSKLWAKSTRKSSSQQQFTPLDFNKIKDFLSSSSSPEEEVCSLLQAVGWRITKAKELSLKKEVIANYSEKDLLGLQEKELSVIETLLNSKSSQIKESAANFIDILAVMYTGRVYLAKSESLILLLINIVKKEELRSDIWKHCFRVLQRFVLRKRFQLLMIEQDVIKWIVTTLIKGTNSLGDAVLQQLMALFMFITTRLAARNKWEELETEALRVLDDLLECNNVQVSTLAGQTLCNLFSSPILRKHAKELKMDEHMMHLYSNSNATLSSQLNPTMEKLYNPDKYQSDETTYYDEETDFEETSEYQENFEEYDDTNTNETRELIGEDLLKKYFA